MRFSRSTSSETVEPRVSGAFFLIPATSRRSQLLLRDRGRTTEKDRRLRTRAVETYVESRSFQPKRGLATEKRCGRGPASTSQSQPYPRPFRGAFVLRRKKPAAKKTRPTSPPSQRGLLIRSKQTPASVQLPGRGSGDARTREQLPHSPERLHFSHTIDRLSARSTTLEPQRAARHHQVRPHAGL